MKAYRSILILLVITAIGCKGSHYIPNDHNIPLLEKKGDTHIDVASTVNIVIPSPSIKTAYAFSNKYAAMLNINYQHDPTLILAQSLYYELGVGRFHKNKSENIFELYGLAGAGEIRSANGFNQEDLLKYAKYGIQFNAGSKKNKLFWAFSTRLMRLHYYDKDILNPDNRVQEGVDPGDKYILFEPGFQIGHQGKDVRTYANWSRSSNISDTDFHQINNRFTVGVAISLNTFTNEN